MDIAKHQSKYNVQLPFFEDLIFQNATQETLETLQERIFLSKLFLLKQKCLYTQHGLRMNDYFFLI